MGRVNKIRKAKHQSYSVRVKGNNKANKTKKSKLAQNPMINSKETLIQNYQRLGLNLDPNRTVQPLKEVSHKAEPAPRQLQLEDIEIVDAEFLQNLLKKQTEGKRHVPKDPKLPQPEEAALKKLLKKYSSRDLEKMVKDIKLNTFSWTERQIEKKLAILDKSQE